MESSRCIVSLSYKPVQKPLLTPLLNDPSQFSGVV